MTEDTNITLAEDTSILRIDESEVYVGKVFKNHRDLCEQLGIRYTTKPKLREETLLKLQIYYFDYEKDGYKIKITKVHHLTEAQKRARTLRADYKDYIQELILDLIVDEIRANEIMRNNNTPVSSNELVLSKNIFAEAICLVNDNYRESILYKGAFTEVTGIDIGVFNDWYDTVSYLIQNGIEQALKALQNKCLILVEYRMSVGKISLQEIQEYKDKDGDTIMQDDLKLSTYTRPATEEEKDAILRIKHQEMVKMGCMHISEIYAKGEENTYYKNVRHRLINEEHIAFHFLSYVLSFSKSVMVKSGIMSVDDVEDLKFTGKVRKRYQAEINKLFMEAIQDSIERKSNNIDRLKNEPLKKVREKSDYMEQNHKVTNLLISSKCRNDIKSKIRKRKLVNNQAKRYAKS